MYCIAEFPSNGDKKEIAVVHKNWVFGDLCYYPPFWKVSSKMRHAILAGDHPDPAKWLRYKVRVIGNKYFGSYDDARKQLENAQVSSDLSSDETNMERLRKRHIPAEHSGDDEDSEEDRIENQTPIFETPKGRNCNRKRKRDVTNVNLPAPPGFPSNVNVQKPATPTLVAVSDMLENLTPGSQNCLTSPQTLHISNEQGTHEGSATNAQQLPTIIPHFDENSTMTGLSSLISAGNVVSANTVGHHTEFQSASTSRRAFGEFRPSQLIPSSQINQFPLTPSSSLNNAATLSDLAQDLRAIRTNQELLLAKSDIQIDLLRTLLQGKEASRQPDIRQPAISLPFATLPEFKDFEQQMKIDTTLRDSLVMILKCTGGKNPNQIVYRVMTELMTDELMTLHTFKGHTGKEAFKDSLYFLCVTDAVKHHDKGKLMTKKEIEEAIDYWLRKASTRISKSNRRRGQVDQEGINNTDFE